MRYLGEEVLGWGGTKMTYWDDEVYWDWRYWDELIG